MAEARHVGAGGIGVRIPDLAPGVLDHFLRVAAQLAVLIQRRADIAERNLGLGHLVAGVAVAAVGTADLVGELHAAAVLGDLLAFLPVAEPVAVGGVFHLLEFGRLDLLRQLVRHLAAVRVLAAGLLHGVLVQHAFHGSRSPGRKRVLDQVLHVGVADGGGLALGRAGLRAVLRVRAGCQQGGQGCDGQCLGVSLHVVSPVLVSASSPGRRRCRRWRSSPGTWSAR